MTAYLFELYDFAHYSGAHHARMNQLAADGWRVHTAVPVFTECSVLWEHTGLDSLEEYMSDRNDDRPLAERSAREQYLAQQEDSLSPEGRAEAQRRREEAGRSQDQLREELEQAAQQREEADLAETQARADARNRAAELAADPAEERAEERAAEHDPASEAPLEAPAAKGARGGKREVRDPQDPASPNQPADGTETGA